MLRIRSLFIGLVLVAVAMGVSSCELREQHRMTPKADRPGQVTAKSSTTDSTATAVKAGLNIDVKPFGGTPDGREVRLYCLRNANGLTADIMTYGAIVVSLRTPDRKGRMGDIVLGYDDLQDYVKNNPYFGAIVGRYGNRIAKGKFTLDGTEYALATNNNANHLHGGNKGFDKVVWDDKPVWRTDAVGVKLSYSSADGEEGYPGNLSSTVTYLLTNDDELKIEYEATADKATPVNLTHHGYFNLTGGERDIIEHVLMLNADKFTPVDDGLIPTGELAPVKDTPMDFTRPTAIGARIADGYQQLKFGGGYDHNWVLKQSKKGMTLAARVSEPTTGRVMEIRTTEPGIQFYSGNFLDGTITGKGGIVYKHRWGFCLETQHYPDSPNQPAFPSTILRPGEKYETVTIYRFSAR
ncbi:MAG: galactose mutarotase [Sedimentisphaerales bacterium]|nr:galactose mutarotase [Sedimentisphaerales bacterium]